MTSRELQMAHDALAARYDRRTWFNEHVLGVARLRRKLLTRATGRILEVACGTGQNLRHYPPHRELTAVDLSPQMLEVAREKAETGRLAVRLAVMDADQLEFADGSFDTVVSTLSTCTFPEPLQALREMARVCRPGGSILLLEHGHSSVPWLARYQDQHEYAHYRAHAGCRWTQEPLALVHSADLRVLSSRRSILGMFHSIVATPSSPER
jgi:ubiquinone/menaquinone biosynthesis C-methylase UbiE